MARFCVRAVRNWYGMKKRFHMGMWWFNIVEMKMQLTILVLKTIYCKIKQHLFLYLWHQGRRINFCGKSYYNFSLEISSHSIFYHSINVIVFVEITTMALIPSKIDIRNISPQYTTFLWFFKFLEPLKQKKSFEILGPLWSPPDEEVVGQPPQVFSIVRAWSILEFAFLALLVFLALRPCNQRPFLDAKWNDDILGPSNTSPLSWNSLINKH